MAKMFPCLYPIWDNPKVRRQVKSAQVFNIFRLSPVFIVCQQGKTCWHISWLLISNLAKNVCAGFIALFVYNMLSFVYTLGREYPTF